MDNPFETRLLMRYENLNSFTFRNANVNATSDSLMTIAEAVNMLQSEPATETIRIQSFFLGS